MEARFNLSQVLFTTFEHYPVHGKENFERWEPLVCRLLRPTSSGAYTILKMAFSTSLALLILNSLFKLQLKKIFLWFYDLDLTFVLKETWEGFLTGCFTNTQESNWELTIWVRKFFLMKWTEIHENSSQITDMKSPNGTRFWWQKCKSSFTAMVVQSSWFKLKTNTDPTLLAMKNIKFGFEMRHVSVCLSWKRSWDLNFFLIHLVSEKYTQGHAVLFSNDGPGMLRCGKIPDVLATLDFGADDNATIDSYWKTLRRFDPKGPLMNAEFYPGWLTHWQVQ